MDVIQHLTIVKIVLEIEKNPLSVIVHMDSLKIIKTLCVQNVTVNVLPVINIDVLNVQVSETIPQLVLAQTECTKNSI